MLVAGWACGGAVMSQPTSHPSDVFGAPTCYDTLAGSSLRSQAALRVGPLPGKAQQVCSAFRSSEFSGWTGPILPRETQKLRDGESLPHGHTAAGNQERVSRLPGSVLIHAAYAPSLSQKKAESRFPHRSRLPHSFESNFQESLQISSPG